MKKFTTLICCPGLVVWLAPALLLALVLAVGLTRPASANVDLRKFELYPRDGQVRVHWETATEYDVAGFNILRGTTITETFTVNPILIDPLGSGPTGATYDYFDTPVQNGLTYYYQLEVVNTDSSVQYPVNPPVAVVPGNATITPTPTFDPSGPTATPTRTATPTTTPTGSGYPGPQDTLAPAASITPGGYIDPARTNTPLPTSALLTPSPTLLQTLTPTRTGTLGVDETPEVGTKTPTLAPLPNITPLFPILAPTYTPSPGPDPLSTGQALGSRIVQPSDEPARPRLLFLGGLIVAIWLLLGGFLFAYLRHLGH